MARKEIITKDNILETAFSIAESKGIENVTARKLAAQIGCSTQPIFRIYANMNELYVEIYRKAMDAFEAYYENCRTETDMPFMHLGLAYINYAKDDRKLFQFLFQSEHRGERSLIELLNGKSDTISREFNKAAAAGCAKPEKFFRKFWIFVHGCACMALTGDFDLTEEETMALLKEIYKSCLDND